MSIVQFFRILWAYRYLTVICTVLSFLLGAAVVELVKPRYEAQSRVMLDVIKPDAVTGQVIGSAFLRTYTKTQIETVKDQQVARLVVKSLNLEKDPEFQDNYRNRRDHRDMDFTSWAALKIQDGAGADLIQGSNILEISFASNSPERAKRVADALLKAYMDLTLQSRRETARRNAEWYEAQAEKAKTILFNAENEKAAFERASGIVLQDDKVDIDSARLQALATQGAAPVIQAPSVGPTPAESQLSVLDAQITELSKSMGPNHPTLQALKFRRDVLAKQAVQERATASNSAGAAMNAARATAGLLEAQKAKVMAQRDKVEKLRLMQDEIDLRRDQYNKAVARAAQLRQEAEVADAGVTPLASATTPQSPVFPKKGLIMGVSIPAGAFLGLILALLLELLGRRVRSADDLATLVDAPVLAVINTTRSPTAGGGRRKLFAGGFGPFGRKVARA